MTVPQQEANNNTAFIVGEVPEPVETPLATLPEEETTVLVFNGTDREVPEVAAVSGTAFAELPEIVVFNETSSEMPEIVVVQNSTAEVPEIVIFDETTPEIPEVVIANATLIRVFTTPVPGFQEEERGEVVLAQNPTTPIQYTPLVTPTHQISEPMAPIALSTHAPSPTTIQNKTRTVIGARPAVTGTETGPLFEGVTQEESGASGGGAEMIYRSLMTVGLIAVPVAMFM